MTSSQALWCAAYLGSLLIVGYAIIVWLAAHRSSLEIFGLSACMGPAVMGWWLIAWSLAGSTPSIWSVAVLTALAAVSLLCKLLLRRNPKSTVKTDPTELWIKLLCMATLVAGACFIARDAIIAPTTEWDAFVAWQLKAKILAAQPMTPRPHYFSNLNLVYSQLRYPLLVPMISAGAISAIGSDSTGLEKSPALLFYFGLAAVLFATIRRRRGTRIACLATTFFFALPRLVELGGTGTAEMALIAFYGCSLDNLLAWREDGSFNALILTSLFSAAAAWTKNEGLAMAVINASLVFFARPHISLLRRLAATVVFSFIFSAIYVVWPLYTRGIPRVDEDYVSVLSLRGVLQNLDRIPSIIRGFLFAMANLLQWGLFWPALLVLQLLNVKSADARSVAILWCALFLQACAVAMVYCVATSWKVDELMSISLDRMLLHLTPAAAILTGLLWPENLKRTVENGQ
jgi:hypothetical protein